MTPTTEYREIPLTQGYTAIVDEVDFKRISRWSWCVRFCGHQLPYAARGGYVRGKRYDVLMHRQIMNLSAGDGKEVDHINRNPLDNRRSNLRLVTRKENLSNRGPRSRTNLSECCRLERLFPFAVTVNYWRGKWVVKMHRVCISPEDVENLAKSIELR